MNMTRKERFLATVERREVDRPASWIGLPHQDMIPILYQHFGVSNSIELSEKLQDDLFAVAVPYNSPDTNLYHCAFRFSKLNKPGEPTIWSLSDPGVFEDVEDPAEIENFDWPDPEKYIDPQKCLEAVESIPEDAAVLMLAYSAHFQDLCSAFGMQRMFEYMLLFPEVVEAVAARIEDYYLRANKIVFEATKGKVDCILMANDMGAQRSLMLSPDLIRRFVIPTTKKLIDQAHAYGIKVIYHSCGNINAIIPDLIEAGADIIHPMQPVGEDMAPEHLKQEFGDKVTFCGGVDVQHLMVHGSQQEVADAVEKLIALFPTGLVVSPSHEALLPDVPPENVAAMYQTLHK